MGEVEPTGQIEHAAEPVALLNVPAPHAVQDPPFTLVYPALQVQSNTVMLPIAASDPGGHALHALIVFGYCIITTPEPPLYLTLRFLPPLPP